MRQLRALEDENTRLKRLVADLSLDKHILTEALRKKSEAHTAPRLAAWVQCTFVSCVRACHLAQFSRAAWYRRSTRDDQGPLRSRIRELAHARPRFGFNRIWVLLRREGWRVNKKRVRRLCRLDGLRMRPAHIALHRGPAPTPIGPAERWSMDFVHDALADGRPFRVLTTVDHWSRECPLLEVATSFSGAVLGTALDGAIDDGPARQSITVDHGTEFVSRALEDWACVRRVQLDFIRPGKPVEAPLSSPSTDGCATSV